MSSSTPSPRFLLDENVRIELARFLRSQPLDVKVAPRSSKDPSLAAVSHKERRVLVTNDEDFTAYGRESIFGIVWLKIPQNDPATLVVSFRALLTELKRFEGRLVILSPNTWTDLSLGEWESFSA